ncbi:Alpha/Beta hydrolase protein [Ampelomyces quisqualis]|uniref:Alpha/Beta hydrolase protein n=1 Tax=Ampelomyces quisqualis TaxID=50730 RepID=A0A6A5QFL8_AMPQU|nr:Alpha/Beta hydrolase protein [Ampelomyces quisqualis]
MTYSPPASAKPFTLNIPDHDLSEWRQLLQLSKPGPTTYENTQTKENYGVTKKWLTEAKDYWLNTYDWRAQEKHINSFDNFRMQIDDIDLHFVAYFSEKKDAIPIVFMHGWPGSFIEFLPMLANIRKQYGRKNLPYHIIVPSLPGYPLSAGLPTDKNWTMEASAHIIHKLMTNLGFEKYLAQGGDVGSFEARILAHEHDACVGIHVNLFTTKDPFGTQDQPDESKLTDFEKKMMARIATWRETGAAYANEHGTRPSTIGHVLSSNPLALLAWIGEKFLEWSDEPPSLDEILTNISLYWFTSSFPRSIYPYRQLSTTSAASTPISKPLGVSWFLHEILPAFKHVIEKENNLVYYKRHERGGHFAALERPVEFWGDVEEFAGMAWKV